MLCGTRLCRKLRSHSKYPALVSYHRLPWEQLAANSFRFHEAAAPHYMQLLSLASQAPLATCFQKDHLPIPQDMQLRLLPGSLYFLPNAGDGTIRVPDGWELKLVEDSIALQFYGSVEHTKFLEVAEVATLTSPDLRLFANAVHLKRKNGVNHKQYTDARSLLGSFLADEQASKHGITLFHFYRPNRPANEVTQSLLKHYQHVPSVSVVDNFHKGSSWTPRLEPPKRTAAASKVTPAKPFVAPQSYLQGLAERLAIVPGNSFGRRSLMWGHWF